MVRHCNMVWHYKINHQIIIFKDDDYNTEDHPYPLPGDIFPFWTEWDGGKIGGKPS